MDTYRIESVRLRAKAARVFDYLANPAKLPEWTNAFKAVRGSKATLVTPSGTVEVGLQVKASEVAGTVDWQMTFPDQSVASAYSRVIPEEQGGSLYTFVLMAPPVPLEQLEGTLEEQARILREELAKLRTILGEP
jgi:uncharacterized protein YndB with AHSA1/START domain